MTKFKLTEAIRQVKKSITKETITELVFASGKAFRQGVGLGGSEIDEAIKEGLVEETMLKVGQKYKFDVPSTGRNHFGTLVQIQGEMAIVDCPGLYEFDESNISVPVKSLITYIESDKMEEAGEELVYLLRAYNEKGICPEARQKMVELIHLLGCKTDKEQFNHGRE